ncbi:MAG: helix-turn-helix transcriptional regulator [Ruminococcaceae bacterium]|nr:helix-turn-helix transcriptional regulator [Oscillospiraceae bacterium]
MDNLRFYNSFHFAVLSHKKSKHTDNSRGIDRHFIGRMRRGCGKLVPDGKEPLLLAPGDVFYLPQGLRYHSYWTPENGEDGTVEWESYGFDFFPCKSGRQYAMQKLSPSKLALTYLDQIGVSHEERVSSVGFLYAFLGEVFPTMQRLDTDPRRELFSKAQHYIYNHKDLKVPELARHCGMSESGLYAFFRSYAQTTPIEEKNRVLVNKAITLLGSTDLSVEEISDRVGFQSVAYFRKIVRKNTGKTPTEIRLEQSKKFEL